MTLDRSREAMDRMIDDMIDTYSADYKSQWHGLSEGYREGMMNGIVGFEMTVTRLEGAYKLSQNRGHAEQAVSHAADAQLFRHDRLSDQESDGDRASVG